MSTKLTSGGTLPAITLPVVGGSDITLGKVATPGAWQVVIVYRGLHCPLCNKYLKRLEELREGFDKTNAELIAISGDPLEKAQAIVDNNRLNFRVGYDLSIAQMRELGLYISDPRSPEETDRPFAEPATFVLNGAGRLHLIEISNTPFNRADLRELLDTIEWVQENDYPIRGAHA